MWVYIVLAAVMVAVLYFFVFKKKAKAPTEDSGTESIEKSSEVPSEPEMPESEPEMSEEENKEEGMMS